MMRQIFNVDITRLLDVSNDLCPYRCLDLPSVDMFQLQTVVATSANIITRAMPLSRLGKDGQRDVVPPAGNVSILTLKSGPQMVFVLQIGCGGIVVAYCPAFSALLR
jgi:hypothetical protein